MEYRRLGRAGIKVSALSIGSWVTYGTSVDEDLAFATMEAAKDAGVNFFDNAEVYAGGNSETIMGSALRKLAWPRYSYLISTKFFWGIHDDINTKNTLNRKYLLEAMDDSLERLGLSYVDIAFCHRSDPETPIDETVAAMSDMITRGKALYWGTSEWSASEIRQAFTVADKYNLRPPVTEQPQYNILHRDRVENEYDDLYTDFGIGLTTWSPLASGLLSGKYVDGVPSDSRGALPGYEWLRNSLTDRNKNQAVVKLKHLAESIGATPSQLALAFCLVNKNVSTIITGATSVQQVNENMDAIKIYKTLNTQIMSQIEEITQGISE